MKDIFCQFFESPTAARFAELMAMWPHLSDETKIVFFTEMGNRKELKILVHLRNNLCSLALESANPYIRYLAAKNYFLVLGFQTN